MILKLSLNSEISIHVHKIRLLTLYYYIAYYYNIILIIC